MINLARIKKLLGMVRACPADMAIIAHADVWYECNAALHEVAPVLISEYERVEAENAQLRLAYDAGGDSDERWDVALRSALSQFEGYVGRNEIQTPEQRRVALNDALQHAVGLLRLDRMRLRKGLEVAERVVEAARGLLAEDQPREIMNENFYAARGCLSHELQAYDKHKERRREHFGRADDHRGIQKSIPHDTRDEDVT